VGSVDTDDVVVIVPVLNEASVLGEVIVRLRQEFDHVVCVDDGSTDASASVAAASGAALIRHAVNLGQGAALQTGFDYVLRHTQAQYVVTFDGDGQHDVRDAVNMLAMARRRQMDVVLATREGGRVTGQSGSRRLLLRAALVFTRLNTRLSLTDTHNGLRVLTRDTLARVRLHQRGMAYASELERAISDLHLRWCEVPVSIVYTAYTRRKGQRNINALNVVYDLLLARLRTSP
jgi:glycosyltransferase involved in cell wall biosynthesis